MSFGVNDVIFDVMKERKKTFTYASKPSVVKLAKRAAEEKDGVTLSERIDEFVNDYARVMFPVLYDSLLKKGKSSNKGLIK